MAPSPSISVAIPRLPQLPSDHSGLELHRAAIPPTSGNPQWHLEIPRGNARPLKTAETGASPKIKQVSRRQSRLKISIDISDF
jgi:hypothetical protein